MGDKWPPKCLVSSSRLVRLPSWPLGPQDSHSGDTLPSPLSLSLSSILSSGEWTSGSHSITL